MKRTFHKKQRSRYAGHKSRLKKSDNWSKPKDGLRVLTQYPYSPVSRNGNGNGHHERIMLRSYDHFFLRDSVLVAQPRLARIELATHIADVALVKPGHPVQRPTFGRHPGLRRHRRARRIIDAMIADCR